MELATRLSKAWRTLAGKEERSLQLPSQLMKLVNAYSGDRKVTEDSAFALSAVYAAIDQISSSLASLPLNPMEKRGEQRIIAENHDQYPLLKRYSGYGKTAFDWKKQMWVHALGWGNGLSEIVRDPNTTRPLGYKIIHPATVNNVVEVDGMPVYLIQKEGGGERALLWNQVIHIKAMSDGSLWAKSPIRTHADTISAGLNRNEYSSTMMKNGGFISGVLSVPTWMSAEQKKAITDAWQDNFGGASKAGKTPLLEGGMEYKSISINPVDAQLVEIMNLTIEEVARIFLIPPHKIGHLSKSSFSNIEQQSIEYVQDCLIPWGVRLEQELDIKIFRLSEANTHYTKHEFRALLRGDVAAQTEHFVKMLAHSVYSPNDVLKLMDMNPVDGGDVRFVASNLIDLEYFSDFSKKLADETSGSANTQTGR
jgi:HK97 family phage portal protein